MSDPFVINVRSVPPKPPLPEKKVVPPEPLTGPEYPKEQIVTKRQGLQDGAVRELIKLAREYRDRGEYTQALTELEKALLVNRDSRELQEAIAAKASL